MMYVEVGRLELVLSSELTPTPRQGGGYFVRNFGLALVCICYPHIHNPYPHIYQPH